MKEDTPKISTVKKIADSSKKVEPVAKKVEGVSKFLANYIKSNTYKNRLIGQKVSNPDKVIKERLSKLGQVNVSEGAPGSASLMYMYTKPNQKEQIPAIQVSRQDSDYTTMHELSHATNYGDVFFDPKLNKAGTNLKTGDANTASGKGMSVNEMLYLTDRTKLPNAFKSKIRQRSESEKAIGVYRNPAEGMSGESHSFDPSELKSDLDAVRLLFKKYNLVKNFGDNITEDIIQKASQNKNISNQDNFKRLIKNFSKKNIVEINNNVALQTKTSSTNV